MLSSRLRQLAVDGSGRVELGLDVRLPPAGDAVPLLDRVAQAFFETGVKLKSRHPELYEVLRAFYRQDPAGERPVDIAEYVALIDRFVEGATDGRAFVSEYFATFKHDSTMHPEDAFAALDSLFAAADSFVADPDLRDESDLDEHQLRVKAASALRRLRAITPPA